MREVTFNLSHKSLAAVSHGNSAGIPVLALHGWLDNAASFAPFAAVFCQQFPKHNLICIDWPGHGLSSHNSDDAFYHFVDWVNDLYELIQVNNWQNINIIGHSMGAMVATAFASAFPEMVKSLTLIEAFGFVTTAPENTPNQLRLGIQSRGKFMNKKAKFHPNIESAIQARVAVSDLSYSQAKLLVERGSIETDQGITWRSDGKLRLVSPIKLTPSQASALLLNVQCQVLFVHANQGFELVKSNFDDYANLVKSLKVISIDGGHHIHMERPEAIVSQLVGIIVDNK